MHTRFIVGVIAALGSFTLAFEAIGAESPGPDFPTSSRDARTSSSSHEVTVRLPDGQSVRVGGKAGELIAEGYNLLQGRAFSSVMVPISQSTIGIHRLKPYDKAISSLLLLFRQTVTGMLLSSFIPSAQGLISERDN